MKRATPAVVATFLTIAVGCTSQQLDRPSLEGCALPCWAGITPGLTTNEEAEAIILARCGQECAEVDRTPHYFSLSWRDDPSDIVYGGYMVAVNNNVVLSITLTLRQDALTVKELIDKIGEPEGVILMGWSGRCGRAILYYPSLGVEAWLDQYLGSAGVHPSQALEELELAPAGEIIPPTESRLYDWVGYADYVCH